MIGAKYVLLLGISATALLPTAGGQQAKRGVTVDDAIGMRKLGTSLDDPVALFSPDGQKFVIVLRKGNLQQNTNDYSLLLWDTHQAFNSAKPEILTTLSSSSNRPAIKNIRWTDDGKSIVFLGEHPGEAQQIYSLEISTRTLKKLSSSQTSIVSYTMDAHGQKILYAAEPNGASFFEGKARREGFVVTTQTIDDILTGHNDIQSAVFNGDVQFHLQTSDGRTEELGEKVLSPVRFHPPVMSPDGRYVAIHGIVKSIPSSWSDYTAPSIQWWTQHKRTPPPSGERPYLLETLLLDTLTDKIRPLLGAPTSTSFDIDIAWSPDSRSVVVTNTYLPLAGNDEKERVSRLQTSFGAVEVKVPGGEIVKISPKKLNSPVWSKGGQLVFQTGEDESNHNSPKAVFEKREGRWTEIADNLQEGLLPEIVQEEGLNEPPKIVALDRKTQRRALLLDLNPQFADFQFAHEEAITWNGSDGHKVKGGLYYPIQYERGNRYPLVIQTHFFQSDKFWIDGPFSTAFAAQPLAAQGIMVLQMEENYSDSDSPKEVDREVASLEGAIDDLDSRGLIDRDRVGVIGFSRTCLHVKFALTHSKYHFAAASVSDGVDNGYFQYILESGANIFEEALEGSNGGLPFGEGLKSWAKRSPGFNVDKVTTPLLILAPNPFSALFQWEWYAALKRLGKPVEMVLVEDGEHELQKPWDRKTSLQSNVDWFLFWLNVGKNKNSAKTEQYNRWEELRKLQTRNAESAKGSNPN